MFKHVVGVNLKYEKDDPRVEGFFKAAEESLGKVPQVKSYSHYRVENPEGGYQYGFILDFESKDAWMEYNDHPYSLKFTEDYWEKAVTGYTFFNFIPL